MTSEETGSAAVLSGLIAAILATVFDFPVGNWILEVIICGVAGTILGVGSVLVLNKLIDP